VNPPTPPPRLSIPRLIIAATLVSTSLALLITLATHPAIAPLPPCPIHAATGLHCPGCGSTRALRALAHGDLATAARQNLLLVCSLPALAAALLRPSLHWLHGLPFLSPHTTNLIRRLTPALIIILITFTILRNLPPTAFLAPH
jgi:hypothetical protein